MGRKWRLRWWCLVFSTAIALLSGMEGRGRRSVRSLSRVVVVVVRYSYWVWVPSFRWEVYFYEAAGFPSITPNGRIRS
jgi:hypothetical protein